MKTRNLTEEHCIQLAARYGVDVALSSSGSNMVTMSKTTLVIMLKDSFAIGRDIDVMKTVNKKGAK